MRRRIVDISEYEYRVPFPHERCAGQCEGRTKSRNYSAVEFVMGECIVDSIVALPNLRSLIDLNKR